MIIDNYDLVVLGLGPAGERAAAQAAYFGKKVAVIEKGLHPGGACANTGTLPSKTLREAAVHLSGLQARGLAGTGSIGNRAMTARSLLGRMELVIQSERERILRNMARHGVTVIQGHGEFLDPNTVAVHEVDYDVTAPGSSPPAKRTGRVTHQLRGEKILIGVGSSPHRPAEIPFDDQTVWDSDSILTLTEVPRSLIVVGGGVIGSEYASIFGALGSEVHLVEGRDRILPFLDHDISAVLIREMERLGVRFHVGKPPKGYRREGEEVVVELEGGKTIRAATLLFAAGRSGNTRDLGLAKAGLEADKRGLLKVNANYQTSAPHIYACGDVIGFPALASTSMDQGRLAACHAFQINYRQALAAELPMGIYTIPEVSAIGETAESAKEKSLDFEVGLASFADNPRAQIMGDTGGILKLIFERGSRKILGVHVVCERASDVITPGLIALRMNATLDLFIETVFNFPTLSEAYKFAAYDGLGRLARKP